MPPPPPPLIPLQETEELLRNLTQSANFTDLTLSDLGGILLTVADLVQAPADLAYLTQQMCASGSDAIVHLMDSPAAASLNASGMAAQAANRGIGSLLSCPLQNASESGTDADDQSTRGKLSHAADALMWALANGLAPSANGSSVTIASPGGALTFAVTSLDEAGTRADEPFVCAVGGEEWADAEIVLPPTVGSDVTQVIMWTSTANVRAEDSAEVVGSAAVTVELIRNGEAVVVEQLAEPIVIALPLSPQMQQELADGEVCVGEALPADCTSELLVHWWDAETRAWSPDGVTTTSVASSSVRCETSHLSQFVTLVLPRSGQHSLA